MWWRLPPRLVPGEQLAIVFEQFCQPLASRVAQRAFEDPRRWLPADQLRRDGQEQIVHRIGRFELTEKLRAALAQDRPHLALPAKVEQHTFHLDRSVYPLDPERCGGFRNGPVAGVADY